MYHLNLIPWSYTLPHNSLSIQQHHLTRHRNTSDHFLIITDYTTTFSLQPLCHSLSSRFRNTIAFTPSPNSPHPSYLPLYFFKPWQYPPSRFEVLQGHSATVVASGGIVGGTSPLPVEHVQTSQIPKSTNHISSTVLDTVTDSNIPCCPQHQILDIPLLPRPLPVGGGGSIHCSSPGFSTTGSKHDTGCTRSILIEACNSNSYA